MQESFESVGDWLFQTDRKFVVKRITVIKFGVNDRQWYGQLANRGKAGYTKLMYVIVTGFRKRCITTEDSFVSICTLCRNSRLNRRRAGQLSVASVTMTGTSRLMYTSDMAECEMLATRSIAPTSSQA